MPGPTTPRRKTKAPQPLSVRMNKETILKRANLGPLQTPTGNTRHHVGAKELGPAAALRIVKHEGEAGYYLIRLDGEGNAMTDTFHLSIEDALAQAEWEYRVKQDDWE